MKFLCPQCKAKYRIADEKLAQRNSSRMKCRKCGHVIDIHAASVPESIRPPGAPDADDEERASGLPRMSPPPAAPSPAPAPAAPKGLAPPPRRTGGAAAGPAPKRAGAGTVSPSPKRPVAAPPRRGGGAAAAAQAVAEKPIPTAPSEPKAAPLRQSVPPPRPAAIEEPVARADLSLSRPDFEEDAPTRIHDGASLAAAFSSSIGAAAVAVPVQEEWYIGIDGSPVGPLTFAQLREKASSGSATPESLVWKDGFEEWKPLREFPELVALVEEARAVPAVAPVAPAPSPASVAAAAAPIQADIVFPPSAPEPPVKPGSRREHSIIDRLSLRPHMPHVSHRMAWAGLIVALALGVTIGIVLFSKTEQKEIVKYVEVPASAKPVAPTPEEPTVLEEATVQGGATKKISGGTAKVDPAPVASSGGKGLSGLSGLNGLSGLGPSGSGPGVTQAATPGGQLDGAAISRVVSNFTPSVRRGCWDPALVARSPDAPSSARVAVSITIAPSGSVENVTTSGDPKGYPNLAHCIESKVRGWRFPRSSGPTTANVPFVFAAQ